MSVIKTDEGHWDTKKLIIISFLTEKSNEEIIPNNRSNYKSNMFG